MRKPIDAACQEFEEAWRLGERPQIEDQLSGWEEPHLSELLRRLVGIEIDARMKAGECPDRDQYVGAFPFHATVINEVFESVIGTDQRQKEEVSNLTVVSDDTAISTDVAIESGQLPKSIGRYRILELISQGGFGCVYLARDDRLNREVAIKVPRADSTLHADDTDAFLDEARIVAALDHPHIVPVFDVGETEDGNCFFVCKLVEGSTLADRIKERDLNYVQSARLVATVADALHHAHSKKLVHRDIKPANILIDQAGKPYVADFGLALKEQQIGRSPSYAGTFAYMSPEQARGEGHLVDGRSDIFSLGVVLYELLAGQRPFGRISGVEVLARITSMEVRPPRQLDDRIPKELERICMKALSKRAADRYTTARDLADDLNHYLAEPTERDLRSTPSTRGPDSAARPPANVIPKGLRSFDAEDADFFLDLLPGPRDRDGLPEIVRFWKARLEATDAEDTFRVGLIYGPSGCGKSSLMKAGILPRLDQRVLAVHVEADARDTEARLLRRLRKKIDQLPRNLDLVESFTCLRRSKGVINQKIVVVFDQFEQWLHGHHDEGDTRLIQALRQCDGERVQAVLLVRDDYWMAVTRLMHELEAPIFEGQTSAAVDLFDRIHARKVLAAIGRSYGRLPELYADLDQQQTQFLDQAVSELSQDGMVFPVQLALFAEMVKSRRWTPETLKSLGGTEGVSVTFLEEAFGSATAPPERRLHQSGARAVLKKLLPEGGVNLRGHMRSRSELCEAGGYSDRPEAFDELIRILDSETRLLTPVDPESVDAGSATKSHDRDEKYYQLTHDYLVPALRRWLTRKQKETSRGRAQLLLDERAELWQSRPHNRLLPSFWEYLRIGFLTSKLDWAETHVAMMRQATKHYVVRFLVLAMLLSPFCYFGTVAYRNAVEARQQATRTLVDRLEHAAAAEAVPVIVDQLLSANHRKWVRPILAERLSQVEDESRAELNLSLAALRLSDDMSRVDLLAETLETAEPELFRVVCSALTPHRDYVTNRLERNLNATIQPDASELEKEEWAARQSNMAAALLVFGTQKPELWSLLRSSENPRARSHMIHRFALLGVDEKLLVSRLAEENDPSIRRALILSLGQYPTAALHSDLVNSLAEKHRTDRDAGMRSAIEWLFRSWRLEERLNASENRWWSDGLDVSEVDKGLASDERPNGWGWYVTETNAHTMLVIRAPGRPYLRGAADDETGHGGDHENRFLQELPRSFAICNSEVTARQFLVFRRAHYEYSAENREQYTPSLECPVTYVSWYDAAAYCNWLSEKEGIPRNEWCYDSNESGEIAEGMTVPANYLRRIGYRLPTEAEWEYGCRAGTLTSRYYGSSPTLLVNYAWFQANSQGRLLSEVARLKPNDFGLFDMLGNVGEWCYERNLLPEDIHRDFTRGDDEDIAQLSNLEGRIIRGGKFSDELRFLRSANRATSEPQKMYYNVGFRVVRTIRDYRPSRETR